MARKESVEGRFAESSRLSAGDASQLNAIVHENRNLREQLDAANRVSAQSQRDLEKVKESFERFQTLTAQQREEQRRH